MSLPSTFIVHLYDFEKIWFLKKWREQNPVIGSGFSVQRFKGQSKVQGSAFRGSKVDANPNCSEFKFLKPLYYE
jgi:hypothetical protein